MPLSRIISATGATVMLALLSGAAVAQSDNPSIALASASSAVFETEQASIALEGNATARNALIGVHWVNQFEQRGVGSWSASAQQSAMWSIESIPLRLGVNLLAVTVVDSANHSATLHLAVNRKPALGALPPPALKIGSGTWQNRPIVYQIWNGHRVVEGDIILDPLGQQETPSPAPAITEKGIHPDGLGINYTAQLWPLVGTVHQVPYIQSGSDANLTAAISAFNAQFAGVIQFVPRSSQSTYVSITVDTGGAGEGFSNVGISSFQPNLLQCGSGCTEATWLHEMGHTVGLLHEHQRPDRASFITLNLQNADLPNVPGNFTLFSFDYQTIGLYDHASVMHYGAFDFSKAGLPVLESIPAGIPLSNNGGYSAGDIDQVKRLYGATPAAVTVTTNPAGLQIVVDGTTYTAPQSFSFALNSAHTLNLPANPQNTNPADGSTYVFGSWNDQRPKSHSITIRAGAGSLAAPAAKPAVTVYQANFIRLQPFALMSPSVFPSGSGTLRVTPVAKSEFGGTFYVDRTLVKMTLTPKAGFGFFDWFHLPFPPSDNPHSFYIQAPTTAAQAVLVATTGAGATPVTIVGETLTGPNTWNPGLVGSVDGNFTLLPTGFSSAYDGTAWKAGSTHTVSVEPTQSPVTTNVYYNFNTWSDGGAISHTITQARTGSKTIAASVTPFYASYTVPPPLGSANGSCAGGVTTSPPGVSYPLNTSFLFYEDGSSVVATASANPDFPALVFAGWSGSLSDSTNPQSTIIHDQFVPNANFNLSSTPMSITSLSPAAAAVSTGALDVTINGTGFTTNPADTFVYWNGNFRASTLVSSTQLIMHLSAGDLSTAGGQDVFVGNYAPDATSNTCGVGAEASFTVDSKKR